MAIELLINELSVTHFQMPPGAPGGRGRTSAHMSLNPTVGAVGAATATVSALGAAGSALALTRGATWTPPRRKYVTAVRIIKLQPFLYLFAKLNCSNFVLCQNPLFYCTCRCSMESLV